jgi:hypothetical protein
MASVSRAILLGGASAGVLDIFAAFTVYGLRGVPPVRILQSIASGLLGGAAFEGGVATAALGAALHFVIATGAAATYTLASRKLDVLVRRPWAAGAAFGVAVYLFMNFVVLPLSAVAKRPFSPEMAAIMVVVHVFCVGLPIAFAARRHSR